MMKRRGLLGVAAVFSAIGRPRAAASFPMPRARPGSAGWPGEAGWEQLNRATGGRLIKMRSPLDACRDSPDGEACRDVFKGSRTLMPSATIPR